MAKKSRDKGYRGERDLAARLEGQRTSRIGEASPDVTTGPRYGNRMIEVKSRKKNFTTLYSALDQASEYGGEWVAVKDDYRGWLLVCTLDTWKAEHDEQ